MQRAIISFWTSCTFWTLSLINPVDVQEPSVSSRMLWFCCRRRRSRPSNPLFLLWSWPTQRASPCWSLLRMWMGRPSAPWCLTGETWYCVLPGKALPCWSRDKVSASWAKKLRKMFQRSGHEVRKWVIAVNGVCFCWYLYFETSIFSV